MCVLVAVLGACTPHDEPEHVATLDDPRGENIGLRFALEGDRLYIFQRQLYVLDLVTREGWSLGSIVNRGRLFLDVAVSDGWAYWITSPAWDAPDGASPWVGRITDGMGDEEVNLRGARQITAAGGCAFISAPPALHRWCPADPAPVELTAVAGLRDDVAVDADGIHYFNDAGLMRADETAATVLIAAADLPFGVPGGRHHLATDATHIAWWADRTLFVVPKGGKAVVLVEMDPGVNALDAELAIDEAGFHFAHLRLRHDAVEAEAWLPRWGDTWGDAALHTVGDGRAAWAQGTDDGLPIYVLPTDADSVAPPGGDEDTLRPPFL
jgi:hypothetical protein